MSARVLSPKAERVLRAHKVRERWARGEDPVLAGPAYRITGSGENFMALAFRLEGEQWWVGLASSEQGKWAFVEGEPFSLRTLGYYERWLKRRGSFAGVIDEHGEVRPPVRKR